MPWRRQSYDVLPALSVRGNTLRRAMRNVTIGWIFCMVWMSCVMGSRLTIFARFLGFEDEHFGLMTAITFTATFGQFVAVILIERTGLRKYQFLYCGVASRALWIAIAAVPLILPVPSHWAVWTMLALLAASSLLTALMEPAWHTWMGDLIPRRIRGRYFATRSRWATIVKIPLILGLAVMLGEVTREGRGISMTAADQPILLWTICGVFAIAGLLGIMDILQFRHIRDVISPGAPGIGSATAKAPVGPNERSASRWLGPSREVFVREVRRLLLAPLGDRSFRRYVFYGACMMFALAVGQSYFWLFLLEGLGLSQLGTDTLFMVLGPLSGLAAVGGWGKLIDRWGRRPVLMLATAFTVLSIMPYFFASTMTPNPQFVIDAVNGVASLAGQAFGWEGWQWLGPDAPVGAWLVMSVSMFLGGVGWSGVMLAQQGIILSFSDAPGRSKHVAAYRALASLGGLVGGLIGAGMVWLLADMKDAPIVLGPLRWNHWHGTFALSWLARIVALLSLIGMPDPGSRRFRDMARYLGVNVYGQIGTFLLYPTRIFSRRRFGPRGPRPKR